ncbi:hypothetical protein FKM82_006195 [Ascaphus truei]
MLPTSSLVFIQEAIGCNLRAAFCVVLQLSLSSGVCVMSDSGDIRSRKSGGAAGPQGRQFPTAAPLQTKEKMERGERGTLF